MRAMVLEQVGGPLALRDRPDLRAGFGEILLRVDVCGVCRTDLHLLDGELQQARLPVVPGHEIVGRVEAVGEGVAGFRLGQRVGVPWLGRTCGHCPYCLGGLENLCDFPEFTGCTRDGGYAEQAVADALYALPLDEHAPAAELAPLLCAGLIGWRALRFAGQGERLGLYGFGAAAHLLTQIAVAQGREVFAFTRAGDHASQAFARKLGAVWAGSSDERPPEALDAAIIFAPVGALAPLALAAVRKGGRVVCGGIHMSDIPGFPYELLWGERSLASVANLTREDGETFFPAAHAAGVRAAVRAYPLSAANEALADLREGRLEGAAVLIP